MATISTPGQLIASETSVVYVQDIAILHPNVVRGITVTIVQDELSLAPRLQTSDALFSWGN